MLLQGDSAVRLPLCSFTPYPLKRLNFHPLDCHEL